MIETAEYLRRMVKDLYPDDMKLNVYSNKLVNRLKFLILNCKHKWEQNANDPTQTVCKICDINVNEVDQDV